MLDTHLIAKTMPIANGENIIYWKDYRVTVLQDRLFRLEKSPDLKFRDEATQTVWFRDMQKQNFVCEQNKDCLILSTDRVKLILKSKRRDCRVIVGDESLPIDNRANLGGTYRTLDQFDGDTFVGNSDVKRKSAQPKSEKIKLETGVCALNGVAVLDDSKSLTLGADGEIRGERANGSDEYIFCYGDDYRGAVNALYLISGSVPLIPRSVLGNWWSRYYVYDEKSYLRLLNSFEEQKIPLSVATIDMDWHYSTDMEGDLHITEKGRNNEYYGGNDGWTGYSWNKRLFPDYKNFLKKIKQKNLKITLNVHPALGVRWWEDCYLEMANALGKNGESGEWIKFDIASPEFINAYFKIIHKPFEKEGVDFWWIDWQQGVNSAIEGLDPLWSLNHYHYLDNGLNHKLPVILSRFSGAGAHRYPLGFSGDTVISWDTLEYLPQFTATATNVGYTWWNHDIGGHMFGDKNNELYLRHIQYGVFSPINRLHCTCAEVCTKEPWAYGNGAGEIAKRWLQLRHQLIPYLYTAAYLTAKTGRALCEPLYNEWKQKEAYEFKNEYLFGSQLLVAPITSKADKSGFSKVNVWIPEGKWTDIFTGACYTASKGGKRVVLRREMESIPVLIKEGGILPLSLSEGNGADNPTELQVNVYSGNGEYTLYEDGAINEREGELFTFFKNVCSINGGTCFQVLTISTKGDLSVIKGKRTLKIRFKDIENGEISLSINGVNQPIDELLTDCVALDLQIEENNEYQIKVEYKAETEIERLKKYALQTLIKANGETESKNALWHMIKKAKSKEEYLKTVDENHLVSSSIKECLKEVL